MPNNPDFIVIGGAKCGTTSLCDYLGKHPQIEITQPKEPHFFSRLRDSAATQEWYESLFEKFGPDAVTGEGSTSYTSPGRIARAARQIRDALPDVRLIYIMRNPLERLESDWRMRFHQGWAPKCINDAVVRQPELSTAGLYWSNYSVYRQYFSRDDICLLFLEDLKESAELTVGSCFDFLNVDKSILADIDVRTVMNESAGFRDVNKSVRWLVESPAWTRLKNSIPAPARRLGKSILSTKLDFDISWDPVLLDSVLDEYRSDSAAMLEYCGKPRDFWDFDKMRLERE